MEDAPLLFAGLDVRFMVEIFPRMVQALLVTVQISALALLLFLLVVPLLSYFLSPLMAQLSRKHEFEADAYAKAQTNADHLASALLKLYQDNASTLTPDPWYVRFYYSHPPASERLSRLRAA